MKSRSLFLVLLIGLPVVALLTFANYKYPPCYTCQTPVPVFTTSFNSINIKTDPIGPNLDVRLQVSSYPGNTTLFLNTIPAGAEQLVTWTDSIGQVRVRMEYLPKKPSVSRKPKCVCPVDVIINSPCRGRDTIVMDVIIQYGGCDTLCISPSTAFPLYTLANQKLTLPAFPIPASNALICRFKIKNQVFNVEYQNYNKLAIKSCGNDFTSSTDTNGKTTFYSGGIDQFYLTHTVSSGGIIIEIERKGGVSDKVYYCTP